MAGPDSRVRYRWWELSNGKYMSRSANETLPAAQERYNADPNLAITTPQGEQFDGIVESHNINEVSGYALDRYSDTVSPNVHIWINGNIVATVPCNMPRPDVAAIYTNATYNRFGFSYIVPNQHKQEFNNLRVTLEGEQEDLLNSNVSLGAVSGITSTTTTTTAAPALSFNITAYNVGTGVLQYNITGGNGSPITLNIPGMVSGIITKGQPYTFTFPVDVRNGTAFSGTLSQYGNTIAVNFTTGAGLNP